MENQLRQLQITQLEILRVFDSLCQKYGLRYSLYAGTLLGAVRHQGFIPWDDDLDVCMPRTDYEKFLEIWSSENPSGYVLQNKENSPKFTQSFSKIRKDHTTFLQFPEKGGHYHTGIFVDVFPIDRIPNGKIKRVIFFWTCMKYQLLTREFLPPQKNKLIKICCSLILACIPTHRRLKVRKKLLNRITKYNGNSTLKTVGIETINNLHTPFPSDLLDHYTHLPFEGGLFMCFKAWNSCLQQLYGDYMQLPPEKERTWKHKPTLIDFDHNYEELYSQHES